MIDKTIAVLPFVNMSASQENEYFSDGITEEIINALAKIKGLRVTSRTSSFFFKNKNIPIVQIGKELNVSIILEGSVRLAGNMLRITAQLIQAEKDFHFWSDTWDRGLGNIFEIQDEVSLLIADKLREHIGHFEIQDHLVNHQTINVNAYELFLKARFYFRKWNPQDVKTAIEFYNKALELDPNHAESILGLADCYSFLATTGFMPFEEAWGKAATLTHKGMQLNTQLASGHYQLANLHFFTSCDYSGALKETLEAITLTPNFIEAQQYLSFLYILAGKKSKAKEHLKIALNIDPLSQETLFFSAYFDYMTGNYKESLEKLNRCLDHNPKNIPAYSVKCYCLLKLGLYNEVLSYLAQIPQDILVKGDQLGITTLAYVLKKDTEKTKEYMVELKNHSQTPGGFRADSFLLFAYALLNEKEKAFEWIKKALKNKSSLLILHFADPLVDSLKTDSRYARFQQLIFPEIKTEVKKVAKALLDDDFILICTERLNKYFAEEKPYLDPNLSLRSLAAQIEIHPNQLSWLLNEKIKKNFNEFINHYRIEEFKRLANDSRNAHLTLLGLAYESGFNSKTVFNTYFKRETGLTPSQYFKGKQ